MRSPRWLCFVFRRKNVLAIGEDLPLTAKRVRGCLIPSVTPPHRHTAFSVHPRNLPQPACVLFTLPSLNASLSVFSRVNGGCLDSRLMMSYNSAAEKMARGGSYFRFSCRKGKLQVCLTQLFGTAHLRSTAVSQNIDS